MLQMKFGQLLHSVFVLLPSMITVPEVLGIDDWHYILVILVKT